jgi:hypothetical protein
MSTIGDMTIMDIDAQLDALAKTGSFRYRRRLIHQTGSQYRARISIKKDGVRLWRGATMYSLERLKAWISAHLDGNGEAFPG